MLALVDVERRERRWIVEVDAVAIEQAAREAGVEVLAGLGFDRVAPEEGRAVDDAAEPARQRVIVL